MINYIILVHGTWGKGSNAWYQIETKNNNFATEINNKLNINNNQHFKIYPFEWSGENTHSARLKAGDALADTLIDLFHSDENCSFHFIAHSHGGNVVLKAIEKYLLKLTNELTTKKDIKYKNVTAKENILQQTRRVAKEYNIKSNSYISNIGGELERYIKDIESTYKFNVQKEGDEYIYKSRDTHRDIKYNITKNYKSMTDLIVTYSEFNRIHSITTLGTPFYYKKWDLSKLSILYDKSINFFVFPLFFFIVYLYTTLFAFIISILPSIDFIGFNITTWHWGVITFVIFFTFLINLLVVVSTPPRTKDTNVYFDLSKIHYFMKNLGKRKICPLIIIHAHHLDEAFLGLSTLPISAKIIKRKIKSISKPIAWRYKSSSNLSGVPEESLHGIFRTYTSGIIEFIKSFLNLLAFPIYWFVDITVKPLIINGVFNSTRSSLLGLPESEFRESTIEVRNTPTQLDSGVNNSICNDVDRAFSIHSINVEDHIKEIKINKHEEDRYSFLTKNGIELDEFMQESMIIKEQSINYSEFTDIEKKNILALEERGKEFFGIAGLRHSMYYEQSKITEIIVQRIQQHSKD